MYGAGVKRRRVIVVLLACIVAAVVVAVVWPREREPEYGGKKLSEWLLQYQAQYHIDGYYDTPELHEAEDAVRHIGTNALPSLLRWVRYEQPAWRDKLLWLMEKMPRALQNDSLMHKLHPYHAERPDWLALAGFEILGPRASPAVPELARLVNDRNASRAMSCLIAIREPAREALKTSAAFTSPDPSVRKAATNALERIEGKAR